MKWEGNEPQRCRSDWGTGMSHEPVGLPAGVTVNQDEIDRIKQHYTQGIECWDAEALRVRVEELEAQLAVAKAALHDNKEFERREIARAYFAACCANPALAEIDPMDHVADAVYYAEALQKALDGSAALPKPRLTVNRRRMLK